MVAAMNVTISVSAQSDDINLFDEKYEWLEFGAAVVFQNSSDLSIIVSTDYDRPLFNRAFLPVQINSTSNSSLLLDLEYWITSNQGNAAFFAELRDNETNKILWSNFLNGTTDHFTNHTYTLPSNIANIPLEFRFYIWTEGPGEHSLDLKKVLIRLSNSTPSA